MSDEFDFSARYKVNDEPAVAWYAHKYASEHQQVEWWDEENDCMHYLDEYEEVEDHTRVVCCMVGDDRDFTFEVTELTKLADGEYCTECGQIGCGHGAW